MSNQDDKIEAWTNIAFETIAGNKFYSTPLMPNNPVIESILNQDESAQRYSRLTNGTEYKTTSVDSEGNINVKTHNPSDVIKVGKPLGPMTEDSFNEAIANIKDSGLPQGVGEIMKGRQAFINQMALLHRNPGEAQIDVLKYGKPLTTMTEAEYNEAKINKSAGTIPGKLQEGNQITKED